MSIGHATLLRVTIGVILWFDISSKSRSGHGVEPESPGEYSPRTVYGTNGAVCRFGLYTCESISNNPTAITGIKTYSLEAENDFKAKGLIRGWGY